MAKYSTKKINIYSSSDQEYIDRAKYVEETDLLIRFQKTIDLIKRVFKYDHSNNYNTRRITFKKYTEL